MDTMSMVPEEIVEAVMRLESVTDDVSLIVAYLDHHELEDPADAAKMAVGRFLNQSSAILFAQLRNR